MQGRFYIEVAAAAQSVRLTRQEIELQSELAELQLFPQEDADWVDAAFGRHCAVVDAIAARASQRARQLTEEFIAERTLGMIEVHMALTAAADQDRDDSDWEADDVSAG